MNATDDPQGEEPVPPADEVDEIASALLDGEATAAQRARADEPAVAERVATFGRVRDAVAAPGSPIADDRRDAAIAAALATWRTDPRPAVDLAARRRARAVALLRPVGVAAALVAALAIGGVALRGGGDDDDQGDTAVAVFDEGGDATAQESAEDGDTSIAMEPPAGSAAVGDLAIVDLGSFATLDELAAVAITDAAARTGAPSDTGDDSGGGEGGAGVDATDEQDSPLDAAACGPPHGGTVTVPPARAQLAGQAVLVYVVDDDPDGGGQRRVVVVDESTCAVVGERPAP